MALYGIYGSHTTESCPVNHIENAKKLVTFAEGDITPLAQKYKINSVLGPVDTNLIITANAIFCPARQKERRVVNLHKRLITPLGKKWPWPAGLSLKKHHSALLVAYLERPNCTPRALIGAFSGSTVTIKLVSTGPSTATHLPLEAGVYHQV